MFLLALRVSDLPTVRGHAGWALGGSRPLLSEVVDLALSRPQLSSLQVGDSL